MRLATDEGDSRGRDRTRTPSRLPDADTTAERLLGSTEKVSFDPAQDVDWEQEPVEGLYWTPPELLSLHGTDLWDRMSQQQRIELSRHEMCSVAATGVWFEVLLMRMLSKHVYDSDLASQHTAYVLTEVADECNHSIMFTRMIRTLGVPFYAPDRFTHEIARVMTTPVVDDAIVMGATLYVEAVLDRFQQLGMQDERVQPLARRVNEVHVIEEARHMRLASTMLQRRIEGGVNRFRLGWTRVMLPLVARIATDALISPQVYEHVGLDPDEARAAAADNEAWRETRRWAAAPTIAAFEDLGLLDGVGRRAWARTGLLG